jgi:hypothetical protein
MTGWFVCLSEDAQGNILTAKQSLWFVTVAPRQTGFDLLPLTDPPKIKRVGWISGKGV